MSRIRKASPDDLPDIHRVMRASMEHLGAHFYDAEQVRGAVEYISSPDHQLIDDGTYFVVIEDDRIVACGGWSWRKKLFTGTSDQAATTGDIDPLRDAARIRAMFVHPDYARRGLGRLILETSENQARSMGFTHFELMATLPGVPLYEACGYARAEEVMIDLPDGTRLGCVRMLK